MTDQNFCKKEQVEKLLKDLKLKVENFPQKFQKFIDNDKRFFYSTCFTKNNDKVFIKVAIKNDLSVFDSLIREATATKLIGDVTKIKIPKYCDGDFNAETPWFIHEYVEGESFGYFYELDKKYRDVRFTDQLLSNLAILYEASDQLLASDCFFRNLKKKDYQVYLNTFLSFEKYAQRENIQLDFTAILKLLEETKCLFAEKDIYIVAHGDFTLANNIVSGNDIYLTDWESVHINNFVDDLGRLWIQLWLYPNWRKKLLLNFVNGIGRNKKEKFKQIFRVVAINQSFSEIGGGSKLCEKKFSQGVINASLITINKALKGFDALLQ